MPQDGQPSKPTRGARTAPRTIPALFNGQAPQPLHLRGDTLDPNSVYPLLRHQYGELIYAFSGVIEITVGQRHYLAPPQHGVWIPPGVDHVGASRDQVCFSALCLDAAYSALMPAEVCTLAIAPLPRAVLNTLHQRGADYPRDDAELRLFQVLVDELRRSQPQESYLPTSQDAQLGAVLSALQEDPACERSLQQWAEVVHSTERTLSRRCQRDLGMSFSEWTQRLRLLRALSQLQSTQTIQAIALDLGYSSPSAFIAMFQRRMGDSPEAFRRRAWPAP